MQRIMKKIILACCSWILLSGLSAQEKLLTIEDAVMKQRTALAPQNLRQLQWIKGTTNFSWVGDGTDKDWLMMGSPDGKSKRVVPLNDMNNVVRSKGEKKDTLAGIPSITWENADEFSFETRKKKFFFHIKTFDSRVADKPDLPQEAENTDYSAGKKFVAYTVENNLYVWNGSAKVQVTNDAEKNIVNGKSVHREEFGIFKGTFWSPKGNYLAFYRMDQTMVDDYPVIDWSVKPAKAENVKYPMAGGTSHHVTVGVFDMKTQKTIFLKTGEPKEQYLTNIAWSPDEHKIYIAVLNRDQNHLWFNRYNAQTGAFEKTLFEETDEEYVQPLHPMEFVKNRPEIFVWRSERSGTNHLYLYNTDGKMLRQLSGTDGKEITVTDIIGFDEKGENIFYQTVPMANPIGRQIRMSNLSSGKISDVTDGNGTHTATLSGNGKFLIDNFSTINTPREISIYSSSGKKIRTIFKAENPLKDYRLGKLSVFTIKAADGKTDLYCRMIKPVDFDSTKKYPVIVYVYGGPTVQLITDSWLAGSDLWYHYMAQRGYLVFTLDNRGSFGRGMNFEQPAFRELGTVQMHDQMKGVEYLKSFPFVDQNRMGVHGWSFGGFMTITLMTRQPGVFKAGVAGGPVIDWGFYEVMYTERYMDTPQTNKNGYDQTNLLNYIDNIKGRLLIIHGALDDVVVWQHSVMYLKKCVEKGKQVDYFIYPAHPHNVRGKDRMHLMTKISEYFFDNL
jgi:dipeptidyl-peptidase-4